MQVYDVKRTHGSERNACAAWKEINIRNFTITAKAHADREHESAKEVSIIKVRHSTPHWNNGKADLGFQLIKEKAYRVFNSEKITAYKYCHKCDSRGQVSTPSWQLNWRCHPCGTNGLWRQEWHRSEALWILPSVNSELLRSGPHSRGSQEGPRGYWIELCQWSWVEVETPRCWWCNRSERVAQKSCKPREQPAQEEDVFCR